MVTMLKNTVHTIQRKTSYDIRHDMSLLDSTCWARYLDVVDVICENMDLAKKNDELAKKNEELLQKKIDLLQAMSEMQQDLPKFRKIWSDMP
jgi:hypothetical protein